MDPITEYILLKESHPIHRRRAIAKRIEILKKKRLACKKKSNPEKCVVSIDKKIQSLQRVLDRLNNLRF